MKPCNSPKRVCKLQMSDTVCGLSDNGGSHKGFEPVWLPITRYLLRQRPLLQPALLFWQSGMKTLMCPKALLVIWPLLTVHGGGMIEIDRGARNLVARRRAGVAVERQRLFTEDRAGRGVVHDHITGNDDYAVIDLDAVLRQENSVADSGRELCLLPLSERCAGECRQKKQDTMVHRVILI
jgi:hypothetical protein